MGMGWMEVRTDAQTVAARHYFPLVRGQPAVAVQSSLPLPTRLLSALSVSLTASHPSSLPASAHGPLRHHHHSLLCSSSPWLGGPIVQTHVSVPPSSSSTLARLHRSSLLSSAALCTAVCRSSPHSSRSLGLLVLAVEPGCRLPQCRTAWAARSGKR